MTGKTTIEWTDKTWNPIRGCSRVSEGCVNCYAERDAARIIRMDRGRGIAEGMGSYDGLLAKGGQWNGNTKFLPHKLVDPLRWASPHKVFVNSMSDLYHESLAFEDIAAILGVIAATPRHIFQVLTKRPQRMLEFFQWLEAHPKRAFYETVVENEAIRNNRQAYPWQIAFLTEATKEALKEHGIDVPKSKEDFGHHWPMRNLWLGVSIENQKSADERLPLLVKVPAAIRWISAEPLLGSVDLVNQGTNWLGGSMIHWVVVGGESGPKARPMHPEWALDLLKQCQSNKTAFLFKQWGAFGTAYNNMTDSKPEFRYFSNHLNWVQKASTWIQGGSCVDLAGKICLKGKDFESAAYPVAIMHPMKKERSGRLLNGEQFDQYPVIDGV